ncbi:CHAT domain-containing protein [Actinokineospora xionganensis]|uniref:CHAT domain-containing protein n=1 Tax=Actinokineospora xionganensis TaxID=2684470 RepID=A0ABR7L2C4_9PSEU|nr:CHAT domain-containing tetratricopeptide repeat protein [Actinokineospora xionganensis]MBC6446584.1 CHAT domain-containing protein [Actinokineospora xionganensis]
MTWDHHHRAALAHQERGEPLRARPHARLAREHAATAAQAAESALVMAWIAQQVGDHDAAVALIADARPALSGQLLARADCLHGLTLCMTAEHEAALSVLARAAKRLRDDHWRANALVGIGVSAGYLRRPAVAEDALDRAHALYLAQGKPERARTCLHNKGFVAAQAGDFSRALRLYDAAGIDETTRPEVLIDRANALLGVGLINSAGRALARAAVALGATGRGPAFAEATLAHAHRALLAGDPATAAKAAETAAGLFEEQGNSGWLAHAQAVRLRALGRTSSDVADRCEQAGWVAEAAELRLLAGRLDLVEPHRFAVEPGLRALGWLARAQAAGSPRAAFAACRAGGLGDSRLAAVGVDAAVSGGRPRTVFTWAERSRGVDAPTHREIGVALGDRELLDFYVHKGQLRTVSVFRGRFRDHVVGSAAAVAEAAESLRITSTLAARTGTAAATQRAARVLDAMLFTSSAIRELVVLPSPELSSVPWAALPSLAGIPVSVAPSAAAWLRAKQVPERTGPTAWIACPGLTHAAGEVTTLHARHGGTLVTGRESTVVNVLAAMSGAGLVHIAAHGRHHTAAPRFSALALADGPLRAQDIERLPEPPRLLVLSSCESGKADLLGLIAVLLDLGVGTVVASTLPVPDDLAVPLMTDLHERLAAGAGPAKALAGAQTAHGHLGFACYGSPG